MEKLIEFGKKDPESIGTKSTFDELLIGNVSSQYFRLASVKNICHKRCSNLFFINISKNKWATAQVIFIKQPNVNTAKLSRSSSFRMKA